MKKFLTFKFCIKPTEKQKENFQFTFECITIVHNKYIEDIEKGIDNRKNIKNILREYTNEHLVLNTANSSALMNKLFQLNEAKVYRKAEKTINSFTISNLHGIYSVYIFDNKKYIHLGRFGNIEIVCHRDVPKDCEIIKATIKKNQLDKYYVILLTTYEFSPKERLLDIDKSIGLDYSSPHFYVDNYGNKADKPRSFEKVDKHIAKLNKDLNNCKKGGKNYKKIKKKIAKLYIRANNQRNDYLHKESTRLSNEFDIVCIEDLELETIVKNYNLAKRTYDNSYGRFVYFLDYKLAKQNKCLVKVDRLYPSSKTCSVCGYVNRNLTIDIRQWQCPDCGTVHDRDVNAAINIRKKGLEKIQFRRVSGICLRK